MRPGPLLLTTLLLGAGCAEPGDAGPRIRRVEPAVAAPGEWVALVGDGFGDDLHRARRSPDEGGWVALGGRPVPVAAWGGGAIRFRVPDDAPPGIAAVVVTVRGRPSPPASLEVTGGQGRPDWPRRFPDGGPPPGDGGGPDGGSPDPGERLVAEFVPDPLGDGVRLAPVPAPEGELRLEVRLPRDVPPLGGVAFHLAYDGNVLRFVGALPPPDDAFVAREIGAGRVAVGRILDGAVPPPLATLRFRLVGRGEGRVDFPSRHRTLRDRANRPLPPLGWAAGSVRVRSAP